MEKLTDTIVAIATPLGESALSVIRVSGDETFSIMEKVFRKGKERKKVKFEKLPQRQAIYGFVVDPETEELVDEVILISYPEPKSYTTENMVEIMCHGGTVTPVRVLKTIIKAGARLAEPGEFTKRAFLGGRIDLTEAEAVLDIIHSTSEKAQKSALAQLTGELRKKIEELSTKLKESLMLVEASVDFPEEDIEFIDYEELKRRLEEVVEEINHLLEKSQEGKILREGVPTIIIGKPNVGKSSLLNTLLMEERAIVTEIPGTTRDTIEEKVSIRGITLHIIDTAGIRKTLDKVEKIGVERSLKKLEEAQLILFVIDASTDIDETDIYIAELVKEKGKPTILIMNKIDLGKKADITKLPINTDEIETVEISTKTKEGLECLKDKILKVLDIKSDSQERVYINERHKEVLIRAREALKRCLETLKLGLSNEFIAIDLKEALNRLGEITGETTPDDILNMIFERFCIGK